MHVPPQTMSSRASCFVASDLPASDPSSLSRTAVAARRFAGDFAKGGRERTCFAETDIKSDFRHRQFALRQQALGAFDAPAGEISVRRHAERLFERAGKMIRAELGHLG